MQGEKRTVGRERWTLASGGRILAVRSQVSHSHLLPCLASDGRHSFACLLVQAFPARADCTRSKIQARCGAGLLQKSDCNKWQDWNPHVSESTFESEPQLQQAETSHKQDERQTMAIESQLACRAVDVCMT